jgi:pimeloyl-ACP methyl ester carboxylesterase
MAFITSTGLTEAGTSKTVQAGGMTVHYHDIGAGEPVLFLHSYGPGTTAWITFHKTVGALSQHFRCILMDLPNFSKTGPIVYKEGVHAVQARTAVTLLDALGIPRAHFVGNSQGGQSSMVAAITYPERVNRFVMGGSHIGTGGDRYLMANRPSEGSRATREALDNPTRENIRRYLRVHIDDGKLVTDELVDYIHRAHTWSPAFDEARKQSVSVPHDYTPELAGIRAPVLLIHGRYDRMVAFEVSIAILNHVTDSRVVLLNDCGHWPPFEKPEEYTAHVLAFLKGY